MAVITALAASAWFAVPKLRGALLVYIGLNAVTRVAFGAHFPVDVAAGVALGYGSALAGRSLVAQAMTLQAQPEARASSSVPVSPQRVWAVMPTHDDVPEESLVSQVLSGRGLTIVDDGSEPRVARELDRIAEDPRVQLVRVPERLGKGAALRTGIAAALEHEPEAVLLLDADGQHPAESIGALYAAGGRTRDRGSASAISRPCLPSARRQPGQPRVLQLATGRRVRDTQSGMRLLRGERSNYRCRATATKPRAGT